MAGGIDFPVRCALYIRAYGDDTVTVDCHIAHARRTTTAINQCAVSYHDVIHSLSPIILAIEHGFAIGYATHCVQTS